MTPKEKAIDLVNKFLQIYVCRVPQAKRFALICVDEILQTISDEVMSYKPFMTNTDYWQEVKEEINNN
tara:strand:+ start:560 stop:763 length:204 start_codon:yes stop_codon:yes gene_type:complete